MKIKINWKTIAMLLLCVQNSLPVIAQTTEQQYMERYWNYRDRYKK